MDIRNRALYFREDATIAFLLVVLAEVKYLNWKFLSYINKEGPLLLDFCTATIKQNNILIIFQEQKFKCFILIFTIKIN